jgi:uncharacterized membrane protein
MERRRERIASIDLARGLVMILMLLDHARGYWTEGNGIDPLDVARGTPALFLTRWITHLCAPMFVFLTGLSAGLSQAEKPGGPARAFRDLALRGLWLMALEVVVTSALWGRVAFLNGIIFQVIWALGLSLLILAFLQMLPRQAVGLIGLSLVLFHNLIPDLIGLPPTLQFLWDLLHQRGLVTVSPTWQLDVLYPVIPWAGLMAIGWSASPLFRGPAPRRRRLLALSGAGAILLFALLRAVNVYGDPRPWTPQANPLLSLLSFIDVEKYPPSLAYLLVTMGLGALILAAFDGAAPGQGNVLLVLGRVPLFFYLVHLPMLGITVLACYLLTGIAVPFALPLWSAWLVCLALILPLYYLCRAYGKAKFEANPKPWTWLL